MDQTPSQDAAVTSEPAATAFEVCLISRRDPRIALVPCGHQRFCESCAETVHQRGDWCQLCRADNVIVPKQCIYCNDSKLYTRQSNAVTNWNNIHKKLSYRRVTARCVLSVAILPITTQQCRNYLYDKSWPNRWYEIGDLVGSNAW